MPGGKSNFLDRVLGRIGQLDKGGLQTIVQRLARERSFLETLFNTIQDGIIVVDESGSILYFNEAATLLIGLNPKDSEGQPIRKFLPDQDWSKLLKLDLRGGVPASRHEFEVFYPRQRFVRMYVSPLDGEQAGSMGLALILNDATEARQQTFEAIESERIQALTLLAASVAHEIGNPLNALHIHLQLMDRELRKLQHLASRSDLTGTTADAGLRRDLVDIHDRLQQFLQVGQGEITRLDYIISQFLQAIRPTQPKLEATRLNDVVNNTLALLKPELDNRALTVKKRLSSRLAQAPMDPQQIKQVLVNLIKNAMQSMTRGGTLTLRTGASREGIWFSVEDTGGGIPQEKLNQIFQPFYTTKKKGSGLGLMIVQRIVREHHGRIELESHVGQGTVFRVWLPLHERQPFLIGAPDDIDAEAAQRDASPDPGNA